MASPSSLSFERNKRRTKRRPTPLLALFFLLCCGFVLTVIFNAYHIPLFGTSLSMSASMCGVAPTETQFASNSRTEFTTTPTTMTVTPYTELKRTKRASKDRQPFNPSGGFYDEADLPYMSTISLEDAVEKPDDLKPESSNYYDFLLERGCFRENYELQMHECHECFRNTNGGVGGDCTTCAKECGCYCKLLCSETTQTKLKERFVSKRVRVNPPLKLKSGNRLIPRIIHQTWFEPITKRRYPRYWRLNQSFNRSEGWEYRFYTDDEVREFFMTHFPPEVLEAFDILEAGAQKADVFRYALLLVYGGVYSDLDQLLETNFDRVIPPDAGFAIPIENATEGTTLYNLPALSNSFIAAAPGHPYLAAALEKVVNTARNKLTAADMEAEYCPNPKLNDLHRGHTIVFLVTYILGQVVNDVIGRDSLTPLTSTGYLMDDENKAPVIVEGYGKTLFYKIKVYEIYLWRAYLERSQEGMDDLLILTHNAMEAKDPPHATRVHYIEVFKESVKKKLMYGLYGVYKDGVEKANDDIRIVAQ